MPVKQRGGKRILRRRKSKLKAAAVPLMVLSGFAIILFLVFYPDGSSDIDPAGVKVETPNSSQSGAASQYYTLTNSRDINNGGGATTVNLGEIYVDATGSVPATVGTDVSPFSDVKMTLNGPTAVYDPQYAYVVNIEKAYETMFTDIMAVEESAGLSHDKTAAEYAREAMQISGFPTDNSTAARSGHLAGALGPAITQRVRYSSPTGWIDEEMQRANVLKCFGTDRYDDLKCITNLMFVKTEDAANYYNGGDVDVFYVEYIMSDTKAHTAPWGLGQTFIHFAANKKLGICRIKGDQSGYAGDTVYVGSPINRQGTTGDALQAMMNTLQGPYMPGQGAYWAPRTQNISSKFNVANVGSTSTGYSGCVFEPGSGDAASHFLSWLRSGDYTLVGILVYAVQPDH